MKGALTMKDKRAFIRAPALVAALVVALLLLVGTYTVIASPAPDLSGVSISAASWSSGWQSINQGQTLTFNHNLGGDPDDYAVELWFQDTNDGLGINRRGYGGVEANGNWFGAYWENLTSTTIDVHRHANDLVADQVLVRVWVVPTTPDWDSGWQNINQGQTITFNHSLAITSTDLTVGLWFSGTTRGIHHHGFGGLAIDGPEELHGAHWQNLTDNTVKVIRHPDDTDVEQVRVVVVHGDPPHYDSLVALGGWQGIAAGTKFTFEHDLNWNPSMMLVRGECYSSTVGGPGIHQLLVGGSVKNWPLRQGAKGANIQGLTANTVEAYRWPNDDVCPQVRVRIWKRSRQIYLPVVLKNYSPP
jgi:hypothetical protein